MKKFFKSVFPYIYVGSWFVLVLSSLTAVIKAIIYWIQASHMTAMQILLSNRKDIYIVLIMLVIFLILHVIAKYTLKPNRYSNRRK